VHLHRRSLAWLGVDLDVSARLLDEAINLRQAQSGTLADLLSREKGIKGLSQNLLGHSGAVVGDREEYILAGNDFLMIARIGIIERKVLAVSIVNLPPSGMASRALSARLMIAFSSWPLSAE